MSVKVSAEGLKELRAVLDGADREILPEVGKVVSKGALNIKRDWQARWRGLTRLPGLARTITYDTETRGQIASAEIGPDHRRGGQAPLAHIPEYGMPQTNTPPHPGGRPALEAEAPRFERALADVAGDLLT